MSSVLLELVIILVLLVANGVFSMAEIAIVSSRKARLRELAASGDTRAALALRLAESPNTFLATVQVGITLVGVLAAAFSGASLAEKLALGFERITWLAPYAEEVAFGVVVVALTYLTLVIGELAPKRIGLGHPERVARVMAGPMDLLSRFGSPVVTVLGASTDALLRLFRIKPATEAKVTDEEVRLLIREGTQAGIFHPQEPAMVESVMAFDRMPVRDVVTPRSRIIWINVNDSHETIWHRVVVSTHTTFPVYEGDRDHVVGMITVKSIYANLAAGIPVKVRDLMTPALIVPDTQSVSALLETFKSTGKHVALVTDARGAISGLVSLHDLMEAIVGDLPSLEDRLKPRAQQRPDGSWLIDGRLSTEEFGRAVADFPLPKDESGRCTTVADLVERLLGHRPREGEHFPHAGYVVEVIDLDGEHVDKILLLPAKHSAPPSAGLNS